MNHWVIWGIKLVVGLFLSAGVVWGVSFGVANYVVKASTTALQSSIDNLNTNLNNFNNNLTTANNLLSQQLAELRSEKEALAVSIAEKIGDLRVRDTELLAAMTGSIRRDVIRITFDGGKTFEELRTEDFVAKYGQSLKLGEAFAIVEGGFVSLPQ